ncbi:MAG: sulfotransferase domain-containing protein [Phycisphaeraceae bacterium]|nr:sulfotransferase domain-containing protein [Phycisphaeraceae bacterium]
MSHTVTPTHLVKLVPDFLIIGAAKSGTSTLFRYLDKHPQVCFSTDKEPCFFDINTAWDNGWDWYAKLWDDRQEGQLLAEGSTNYTFYPHVPTAPQLIKEHAPNCKLIYMMRHPVSRTFSHYAHRQTKELFPGKPFEHNVLEFAKIDPLILDCSDYYKQIQRYLSLFPQKQILFCFIDEMIRDPRSFTQKVCRFLNLDDKIDLTEQGKIVDNKGAKHRDGKLRYYTTEPFRKNPVIRKIAYALPQPCRTLAYNLVQKTSFGKKMQQSFNPLPMSEQHVSVLLDRFKEGNEQLANFLNVDLSHWDKPPKPPKTPKK